MCFSLFFLAPVVVVVVAAWAGMRATCGVLNPSCSELDYFRENPLLRAHFYSTLSPSSVLQRLTGPAAHYHVGTVTGDSASSV